VGASVSSFGIAEMTGQDLTKLGCRFVPHVNPHVAYLNLKHHVYTKIIVSPLQMEVRYIAVKTVAQSVYSAFLLQRFVVPNRASRVLLKEQPGGLR
jgi:hypothetical protein